MLDEQTASLKGDMAILAARRVDIAAALTMVKSAKAVNDESLAACIIGICLAAEHQTAAVKAFAIRQEADIAEKKKSLLLEVSVCPHHDTLSGLALKLEMTDLSIKQLETTSSAAMACSDVSNRFKMTNDVLKETALLKVSVLPLSPSTSGAITFQRPSANEQAADITMLGYLRDEDIHNAACKV